jgi:hypothetical protein
MRVKLVPVLQLVSAEIPRLASLYRHCIIQTARDSFWLFFRVYGQKLISFK